MDRRQHRAGELHCQWCGRARILIDRHDLLAPGQITRLPVQAVLLCPRCDEAGQGVGPLAMQVALRRAGGR